MDVEKFTDRARGFIQSAQSLAAREGNQQFTSLHLMKVLLDDEEGLVSSLVDRAAGNARTLLAATETELTSTWQAEKEKLSEAQKMKSELEQLRTELADVQRRGEFQRAGELAYSRIPELEKKFAAGEEGGRASTGETVTADKIVDTQFSPLARMLEERKITLRLEAAGRDWLAGKRWGPACGARPLKRMIQRYVQNPLAEMILAGEIRDGANVVISTEGSDLTFNGNKTEFVNEDEFDMV